MLLIFTYLELNDVVITRISRTELGLLRKNIKVKWSCNVRLTLLYPVKSTNANL